MAFTNTFVPRPSDENENENIMAYSKSNRRKPRSSQFCDLEARAESTLGNEVCSHSPWQHLAIYSITIGTRMRFEHPTPRAESIGKTIAREPQSRSNPHVCKVEKENDMRHVASGKGDGDDGGGPGDRPVFFPSRAIRCRPQP